MSKSIIYSFSNSLIFLIVGYLLLRFELVAYGISFFIVLPVILGYLHGKEGLKKAGLIGLGLAFLLFIISLIAGGLEGLVCALMASPLILLAVGFGMLLRYAVSRILGKNESENTLKSTIIPFCVFLILGLTENQLNKGNEAIIEVRSTIQLPYSPMEVYETIKSVDTLDAEKPFLLNIDLPVPQKCVLHEEKVGGLRTCYFEGGQIVERITALEKGKLLKMDVIDYQLTGRKWLGFKEAIYLFKRLENGHCEMTRITTYSSVLSPRFYWQPLEKIGIEQEHEYVFNNLKKDLRNKYGN